MLTALIVATFLGTSDLVFPQCTFRSQKSKVHGLSHQPWHAEQPDDTHCRLVVSDEDDFSGKVRARK